MSRLATRFAQMEGRTALIPFVTAGDPSPAATVPILHALVAAGADIIELGVPFSDPMADGPTIQRANERALSKGVHLRQVLTWVAQFREQNQHTPIVLMGYLNPIEAMGVEDFAREAAAAGVDGTIIVDLTPEEGQHESTVLRAAGIDPIFLLAPTSGSERVAAVRRLGAGFVYYVSLRGITGAVQRDWQEVLGRVRQLREALGLPVAIGFGIRDAATARLLARGGADAVVIGSALVERLAEATDVDAAVDLAHAFLTPVAAALAEPTQVSA
ncbi:MAG: tryptophan synthase subunit alpha [Acidithiobacillus sp.]